MYLLTEPVVLERATYRKFSKTQTTPVIKKPEQPLKMSETPSWMLNLKSRIKNKDGDGVDGNTSVCA